MLTDEQKQQVRKIIDKYARFNFFGFKPEGRYIIMVDNKPVQMRTGFHWGLSWAKTMARRIVHPLWAHSSWCKLSPKSIAKELGVEPTSDLAYEVLELRNEWLHKHVNVIPLTEYIKARAKMTK